MEGFGAFEGATVERTASASSISSIEASSYYVDEEEALGFHVWVAELELLVGNARGSRRADPLACFELLQKLLVTIDRTDTARVREYQRRCETALYDILLKGTAPPIRRLISACIVRLYAVGDTLPLYGRISAMQAYLGSKEALGRSTPETARVGVLQCLAALCAVHGQKVISTMPESLALAVKHAGKVSEPGVRAEALLLMAAVVDGVGGLDRNAGALQTDALKVAIRAAKDHADPSTKVAAARVLQAIARAGGVALWAQGGGGYEETLRLCVAHLDDGVKAVGDAFAVAMGEIAASRTSIAAQQAVAALGSKAGKRAQLERLIGDAFNACLRSPFVDAANADRRRSCTALAQGWLAYLAAQQGSEAGDEGVLVDLALQALEMLANIGRGMTANDGELGGALSDGEIPHAQACVLYILRVGIIEQLGEQGQRLLLERLTALAGSAVGNHVALGIATMEAMGLLLEVLGEISPDMARDLEEPVLRKLTGPHLCLRTGAASVLAGLALAEPSCAARLLEQLLNRLEEGAASLAALSASSPPDGSAGGAGAGPHGIAGGEPGPVKAAMDNLQGCALGAAALLVAISKLPLGVPSFLLIGSLELAQDLIRKPSSSRATGAAAEREAGYVLLASACACLPADMLKDRRAELLNLWDPALSAESAGALDIKKYLTSTLAGGESLLSMEMWWRSAALEALHAFLLGPLRQAGRAESIKLQKAVATLLQPILEAILASPALQDPNRGKGGPASTFAAAAALLQLRLLEVYLAMPHANAFANDHEALSKLCTRAFRGSSPASASAGVASSVASSALRHLLNRQDAVLGPWAPGRDPLEDALQAFAGSPGGPQHHPWEAGLGFAVASGSPGEGADADAGMGSPQPSYQPFPQPRSLGAALLEAQLVLLGNLLAVVSEANQVQILDVMIAAAAAEPLAKRKERPDASKRHAIVTSVCCAALAGLDVLARKCRGEVESRDGVAEKVRGLADAILVEATESGNPSLQRSAAEMFAFAACIGSDAFAAQLVRTLCRSMAETASAPRRAALALGVGCVYRSKGGIALQSAVSVTAQTLMAVARSSTGSVQLWLLHGLWLVANAAGLAFVPHVRASLELALDLLMSEEAYAVPGLRPAVGRLANALVAVLGPELRLGSDAYVKCKSLIREMQASGTSGACGPEDAFAAELETVLYAQSLVLFAPQAVPAAAHLPLLLATLTSRQPPLRRAAANTLRHLAERDPAGMLPAHLESRLFAALDNETDSAIAGQLKASLRTLLWAGAPTSPSYWLTICNVVVTASSSTTRTGSSGLSSGPSGRRTGDEGGLMADEEGDEEDGTNPGGTLAEPAAPPTAVALSESAAVPPVITASQRSRVNATPRLRTRLFAARCLLDVPAAVGHDPRHFDATLLGEGSRAEAGDWLLLQLPQLIDIGFKMATGQVEALRSLGLRLLKTVLKRFGHLEDPLMDGHLLLEQYQAHFVSALRSALAPGASPTLTANGAALAAVFLQKGLAVGDVAVLNRLMGLLISPIAEWANRKQDVYAEWVAVRAKVALLEVHAHFAVFAATSSNEASWQAVANAHAPHLKTLVEQWAALLQDYAVLGSQPPAVQAAYSPRLFDAPSPSVLPTVQLYLERAWPAALSALSSSLANSPHEKGTEGANILNKDIYILLLDVCHLAIAESSTALVKDPSGDSRAHNLRRGSSTGLQDSDASRPGPGMGPGVAMLTAVQALRRLLAEPFFHMGWCDKHMCAEALALLVQLIQHVLEPILRAPQATATHIYSSLVEVLHVTSDITLQVATSAPYTSDSKVGKTLWDAAALSIRTACHDALSNAPHTGFGAGAEKNKNSFITSLASPFQVEARSAAPRVPQAEAEVLDAAAKAAFATGQKLLEKDAEASGLDALLRMGVEVVRGAQRGQQLVVARDATENLLGALTRRCVSRSPQIPAVAESNGAHHPTFPEAELLVASASDLATLARSMTRGDGANGATANVTAASREGDEVGNGARLVAVLSLTACAGGLLEDLRPPTSSAGHGTANGKAGKEAIPLASLPASAQVQPPSQPPAANGSHSPAEEAEEDDWDDDDGGFQAAEPSGEAGPGTQGFLAKEPSGDAKGSGEGFQTQEPSGDGGREEPSGDIRQGEGDKGLAETAELTGNGRQGEGLSEERPAASVLQTGGSDDWGEDFQDAAPAEPEAREAVQEARREAGGEAEQEVRREAGGEAEQEARREAGEEAVQNGRALPRSAPGEDECADVERSSEALNAAVEPPSAEISVEGLREAQRRCLQALEEALATDCTTASALAALQAVRLVIQRSHSQSSHQTKAQSLPREGAWALRCVAAVAPPTAVRLRHSMGGLAPPSADSIQAAAESIKLVVAALPVAAARGQTPETAVMALIVNFVIEAAAPRSQLAPAALSSLAVTLITHIASGPSANTFRTVVASLSPESKARLQAVLKASVSSSSGENAAQGARAGGAPRQSIALKNFAVAS